MTRLLAFLASLLMALGCLDVGAAEVRGVKESERARIERSERQERSLEYRERNSNPERLPRELRESWLYQHEGKDAEGVERGHTLRRHVPDRGTRESIEQHVRSRDASMREESSKPDLSMYADVKTAERAIDSTIRTKDHQADIKMWMADSNVKEDLVIYGRHEKPVGIHFERGADKTAPIDVTKGKNVNENLVVLAKRGDGTYYVKTSYPIAERGKRAQND